MFGTESVVTFTDILNQNLVQINAIKSIKELEFETLMKTSIINNDPPKNIMLIKKSNKHIHIHLGIDKEGKAWIVKVSKVLYNKRSKDAHIQLSFTSYKGNAGAVKLYTSFLNIEII